MKTPKPGVADNKSYKDMYHFNDNFFNKTKKDLPSLNVDDDINSTIKENPYKSNVEIEGEEVVLQPDMTALFKAKGKKHLGGGMDVYLKPESFIFSNDKSLALTPQECEDFEFKKGGKYHEDKNYTPAKVLEKNVNPKHYNTLVNNIADVKKDDLAKKSSALMLEKYIATLGNIAYLQEKKKGFPQGLPEFSQGTAPVYNRELKENVDSQKQYAKYGGKVFPTGGYIGDYECPCGRLPNGQCKPNCPPEAYLNLLSKPSTRRVGVPPVGYDKLYQDPNASLYGKFDISRGQSSGPKMTNEQWIQFLKNESPEHKAKRQARLLTNEDYVQTNPVPPPPALPRLDRTPLPLPHVPFNPLTPGISPNPVTGDAQGVKRADWEFTPWQKISQLYSFGQYAGAKRYMPMRSHYNATYAEPSLLNPEQTIADIKGVGNQQINAANSLNPILRNAQAQSIYGQELDKIPQVRSQYDNQNAQISNQFRQYNNQIKNQETQTNLGLDQNYYTQAIEGRKNFDNMKNFLANQAMNNVMRDVETNQTLAYSLLSRNNPAYGYDWKTGNFTRNKKDIRDSYNTSQGDYLQSLLQGIDFNSLSNAEKIQFVRELQRGKALQYLPQAFGTTPPPYKRGGKVKNPYK